MTTVKPIERIRAHLSFIPVSNRVLAIHVLLLLFLVITLVPSDLLQRPETTGAVISKVRILGTFTPTFDHNITNLTVNQTDPFFLDINCSDQDPLDVIDYFTNYSVLNMDQATGIVNLSNGFNQTEVGNHTVEVICGDQFFHNVSAVFNLEILDVNEPPVLTEIGPQAILTSLVFSYTLTASDPEGDNLTFGANTTLFTVNPVTGFINFTPTEDQIGNYTINFTVFDGEFYDHEFVSFRIIQGPFCGDNACGSTEDCVSCPIDCGACPTLPPQDSGEGATGGESGEAEQSQSSGDGGGGASVEEVQQQAPSSSAFSCDERWECSEWSPCGLDGVQTRSCVDVNNCQSTRSKPEELKECVYNATCADGIQNGGETGIDCGGPCEPCRIESCFDGVQNQGEQGIDCGGPCKKICEIEEFATLPSLEIPGIIIIPRMFPWLLLLIIALLLILLLLIDQYYLWYLKKKKKLDEYRLKRQKYAPIRRKLYKFMINTIVITLVSSFYLYWFSRDIEAMKSNAWMLIIVILIIPSVVSYVLQRYRYYEYIKEKKEKRFKQTHRRELLQIIKLENNLLKDLEVNTSKEIYESAKNHSFDPHPSVYHMFSPCYTIIGSIKKKREQRSEILEMGPKLMRTVNIMVEESTLLKYAKEYPEFESIRRLMKYLTENIHMDTSDVQQELLDEIEELTKPHLKTVVEADEELVRVYNVLAELYETYEEKTEHLHDKDEELFGLERNFTDQVKTFSKKRAEMDVISHDKSFATIYNSLISLFNHYTKKQQLKKVIENL